MRGDRAKRFPAEVVSGDAQLVMARWTGAYRHGNERTARDHPATGPAAGAESGRSKPRR
ncbi:hypothetical protein NKH18_10560 [Streptomyces sp. M10(2022)]